MSIAISITVFLQGRKFNNRDTLFVKQILLKVVKQHGLISASITAAMSIFAIMNSTSVTRKQIWEISYPIILGSIAQNITSVTDTAFLGRVGEVALGASAIGGVFYLVLVMLGFGFGIGAQIIIARRYGEGRQHLIGPVVDHSLYFLVLLALLLMLVHQFFGDDVLAGILHSKEILVETGNYLEIRTLGLILAFVQVSFTAFYVGIARTSIITQATVVMAVVNILMDYTLIFGKFGMPEMGIRGAALASVLAEGAGVSYFILYTFRKVDISNFRLFRFRTFDLPTFKGMVQTATPIMIQHFVSLASWFVFFLLVEKMGEHDLAVSQVMRSVYILALLPIWGFAAATNTLVSYILGQNRHDEVFPLIRKVQALCILVMLPVLIVCLSIPEILVSVYSSDPTMISDSARVLLFVSPASLVLAFSFIMFSGVSGTGNTQVSLLIEVMVLSIYLVMTWLVVKVFQAPIEIVWTVEYVYGAFLAIFSFIYLKSGRWKGRMV